MQDFMVAICVVAALVFVARTLWNKAGSRASGGGCCGCSGCANRSPLRDGSCANSAKGPGASMRLHPERQDAETQGQHRP